MTEYGLLLEDISGNVQFPMDVFSEVAQPKTRKITVYHSSDSHDPKTLEEEIEAVRFGFTGLLQADIVERERKLHYLLHTDNDIILVYFDRDVATYVSMSRGVPRNDPAGSGFDVFSVECTVKGAMLGQVREAVDSRCTTDGDEVTDTDAMRDKAIYLVGSTIWLQLFDVSTKETNSQGLFFKPDGLKMYVIGTAGIDVNEYDLGTAWDISTAVYSQVFDVSGEELTPTDVFFKPDGLKMYVIGTTGQEVNEYDLGVAWDISTAVWLQLFSVVGEEATPHGLFFKPDGLKMYVIGSIGDDVNEYNLGTAWNISTAVFSQLFDVSGEEITPTGLFFKPDGLKMYIIGLQGDDVNKYNLGTAWDITTATYVQNFSILTEETSPAGLFFKPNGTKMYVIGSGEVNEYDLSIAWNLLSKIYFTQTQNDYMLPDGSYNMIARMRQSADAAANIATMSVDVSGNPSVTQDASENYLIYELPFTVDASANGYDLGATITFTVTKEDVSGNLYVDFLGYVAVQ